MADGKTSTGGSSRGRPEANAWAWLLFLAVLLALTRFWRLGRWGLWVDEAFTLHDIEALGGWRAGLAPRGNFLGLAAIGAAVRLSGGWPDEWTLRIVPAVCGALGVPLTFWAFRPRVGRLRAAAAALIVATSSWHLYWSQNARFYTLAQDLALLSSGLFLRGYWKGRVGLSVLAGGAGVVAATAHLSGALVPGALLLAPWLSQRTRAALPEAVRRPRAVVTVLALGIALASAPWTLGLWRDYRAAKAADPDVLRAVAHFALTTGYYVTPVLGAAALCGALTGLARRSPFDLFALLVCALVLLGATLAATQARVTAQYVFVLLPWIAVLATSPLELGAASERGRLGLGLAWLALIALPQLSRQVLYFTVRHGQRPRWREAYEYVWNERGPDDLVVGMCPPVGEYYLSPDDREPRVPRRIVRIDPWNPGAPYRWARFGRRIWIVMSHEWLDDWGRADARALERYLAESCRLALRLPLEVESRDLGVFVYVSE